MTGDQPYITLNKPTPSDFSDSSVDSVPLNNLPPTVFPLTVENVLWSLDREELAVLIEVLMTFEGVIIHNRVSLQGGVGYE